MYGEIAYELMAINDSPVQTNVVHSQVMPVQVGVGPIPGVLAF